VAAVRDWLVYRVGLTGGIASGKSTVAGMFAALDIPVIDTDVIAREVVAPGTPGLEAIAATFGPEMLLPDGALDRRRLRSLVFDNPARRQQLEAILHPRILARMEALCATSGGPKLLVIPLQLEVGASRVTGCWWWTVQKTFSAAPRVRRNLRCPRTASWQRSGPQARLDDADDVC
jgi:dephospho-CoA kinase